MKKIIIIVAAVVLAVLLVFTALWVVKNAQIASLANEIGEKYGVTDFKSKSANFNGQVWSIELHSKDFADIPKEDKFDLMHSISISEEMQSKLVKRIADLPNPLTVARFTVISDGRYLIKFYEEEDRVWVYNGTKAVYGVEGIVGHGYVFPSGNSSFSNKFGTKNTVCAVDGCSKKIATSGDTNCCVTHSNNCGNCGCYIDSDAMFCMSCLEEALS